MIHPLSGVGMRQWLTMLLGNGGVSRTNLSKAWKITRSSLATMGVRRNERQRHDAEIAQCTIDKAPLFLLGHWRSGTTFLENVLCRDPNAGYLNVVQSIHPLTFLTREAPLVEAFGETRRYMDNVKLSGDAPSEEEVAMAVLAPGSFWHGYYFPSRFDHYFDKWVLFEGISPPEREAFKQAYRYLLTKLTLRYQGNRLFLKNPPNTCRIPFLLDLFPDARFVHIVRNPYEVYLSRMNQYHSAVLAKALQPISENQWERQVFRYYREMLTRHLVQREAIPANRYLEVRFEDLKQNPLAVIDRIYQHLELENLEAARPHFESYLGTLKDYQQNEYQLPDAKKREILEHWRFAFEQWNYPTEGMI